jgi:hypothetical protein
MPSFLILGSGFLAVSIDNEFTHKILLIVVVPLSLFALISGFRNHRILSFLSIGVTGLLVLITAVILGESFLGEFNEKALTLFGATVVAYAHFKNYQVCRKLDCNCHD